MQKSDDNQVASTMRRKVMSSTTLNRKYVRPVDGMTKSGNKTSEAKPSAEELKNRAIEKALKNASKTKAPKEKFHFGFGRVMLALGCTAAAVFAIVYFASLNMPDLSLKVASIQTGIDASYPSYIPRDFTLSDITSENGKVSMSFKNAGSNTDFSLVQEKSSWDSSALLNNFVKDTYGDNYTTIREQGLTLYVSGSNACWVNGGIVYKLTTNSGSLTKKQIKSIATSL